MKKKTVFITGVSSGFGYLIASRLLDSGYKVISALRGGKERGEEIFASFSSKINSGDIIFINVNLDDSMSLKTCLDEAKSHLVDGLDVLINNAGFSLLGPIELQGQSDVRLQFETNFFAPFFIIQELLPYLRQNEGRILNLSSLVGFTVFPFYGTYAASKHALDILTEALYYEVSQFNVQVCAIQPGGFKTNFSSNIKLPSLQHSQKRFYIDRLFRFEKFLKFVENKIEKDPNIVADAVLKLCRKKKIPVRVTIGGEVFFNLMLKKFVPDQWRIKVQDWLYKKFFF